MKCLTPDCDREQHSRGLCGICYNSATRAIARKKTTEEELIGLRLLKRRKESLIMTAVRKIRSEV